MDADTGDDKDRAAVSWKVNERSAGVGLVEVVLHCSIRVMQR